MKEIEVYTVAVGNFNPFKKATREAMQYIAKLEGLVGIHANYPQGNLLLFKSENAAKIARNKLKSKGIETGVHICKCFIDEKYTYCGEV